MLNHIEILKLLVGLREVNDLDLAGDDRVLGASVPAAKAEAVRAMVEVIDCLYADFDYEASAEFRQKIAGKSSQVQAMHRKLLDQAKLKAIQKRLGEALIHVVETDDAYQLIAPAHHGQLDQLRRLAMAWDA